MGRQRRGEIGPDEPVVIRPKVLAGHGTTCGAFDRGTVPCRDRPGTRRPSTYVGRVSANRTRQVRQAPPLFSQVGC